MDTPGILLRKAEHRYHTDARFRQRVDRAVFVFVAAVKEQSAEIPPEHRTTSTMAVSMALMIEDFPELIN